MMDGFTTSDGVRLAYQVDDFTDPWMAADTIVLVHPAMSSMRRLYAWVPHLARQLRVVRVDMRGHGGSEIPPQDKELSVGRLARDIAELLDHLGCARAHMVGASAGGFVLQEFAAAFPDRLTSLTLVASSATPARAGLKTWLPRIARDGLRAFLTETIGDRFAPGTDPGLIAWFLDEMDRNDIPWIARFVGCMGELDLRANLPRIVCPVLLIVPGKATILSDEDVALLRDGLRDAELLTYAGMNHNIGDAVPDRLAQDIRSWIERRFGLPKLR